MAFPFIIRQRAGMARTIVLQGRSLPYWGVAWGGTQRLDVNWFPGNPVAVVQVIGQTYEPTTITGMWKDVFLGDIANRASLFNFPGLTPQAQPNSIERGGNTFRSTGSVPAQFAERARALRDAIEVLRREGILLQVEWGSIVRFGFISRTLFPHDREEDINYEIEFTWLGDIDAQPTPVPISVPGFNILSLLKALFALLDKIINTLLIVIFKAQSFISRVTQAIAKLASFVTSLLEILNKLASFVFAPFDVLGNIRANLTAIKLAALDFFDTLTEESAAVAGAITNDPVQVSIGNILQQRLRSQALELAAFSAQQEEVLATNDTVELLGIYTSPGGVTLRDVALRFFNDANNWRVIADFNGLTSSILPIGTIIRIPKL